MENTFVSNKFKKHKRRRKRGKKQMKKFSNIKIVFNYKHDFKHKSLFLKKK